MSFYNLYVGLATIATIKSCKLDIVSVIPAISVQIYRLWSRLGCVMMLETLYLMEVWTKTTYVRNHKGMFIFSNAKVLWLLFSDCNDVMKQVTF